MKISALAVVVASAAVAAAAAQPQSDMRIIRQTLSDVMSAPGPDQEQFWENPATGSFGTVRPGAPAVTADGRTCRDFTRTWTYDNGTSTLRGSACRDPNGIWRLQDEAVIARTAASAIPPSVFATAPAPPAEPAPPVVLGRLPGRATLR